MDITVSAAEKRLAISASEAAAGGFYPYVAQGLGAGYDAQLQFHMPEGTIRLDLTDEQIRMVARTIDCYLQAVTGEDLWGNGQQVVSAMDEARYYAEQEPTRSRADLAENGPTLPQCEACGAIGRHTGHVGCEEGR